MARIELSAEVKAIESLIDAGQQVVAANRLQAAHANLGRRPEYRYLVCLYDSKFNVRPDRELLREVVELVGEQPDLMEATALLAELYARTGDGARADLFARLALESPSPSARTRANEVLSARANDIAAAPPSSHVQEIERPSSSRPPSARPPLAQNAAPLTVRVHSLDTRAEIDEWFEHARRELVHRRSPQYGVRTFQSIVEMLLDWGRSVAHGNSFVSPDPLPLARNSLALVDEAILAIRRQPGGRSSASKSDTSRTMAAAGFFLAVVLHELEANVIEIAPDDGGCKVMLPSGAGTRPLLVAAAFAEGTGPGLVQTFDRLATARGLASGPPSSEAVSRRPASSLRPSTQRIGSFVPPAVSYRDDLALTRPEAEANPVRLLEHPPNPADSPPLDLPRIASALATSPVSQDIAARSGAFLAPLPASIEALESYCQATQGDSGAAPDRSIWQPTDDEEETILSWGALLGQTLIASYGGIWECDPNAPNDHRLFRVICDDRVAAWPITQVYLRLKDGPRHDLVDFLAAVGKLLD